jgi:hypothetical protein
MAKEEMVQWWCSGEMGSRNVLKGNDICHVWGRDFRVRLK